MCILKLDIGWKMHSPDGAGERENTSFPPLLLPESLYMTLIAVISMTGLAQLMQYPRSSGAWMMFAGTLFYIAENGLYTADHYMRAYHFGVNIVHPFFIMAQTFMVCGYLLRERE